MRLHLGDLAAQTLAFGAVVQVGILDGAPRQMIVQRGQHRVCFGVNSASDTYGILAVHRDQLAPDGAFDSRITEADPLRDRECRLVVAFDAKIGIGSGATFNGEFVAVVPHGPGSRVARQLEVRRARP